MEVDQIKGLHGYLVSLKDGKCSGKELQRHQYFDSFEALQNAPHLFWMAKHTDDNWEIRAKVKIRLCGPYLDGNCFGTCDDLHLCKNFVISGKFCPGQCKFRLSHDLHDAHNERVWSFSLTQNEHYITTPQMTLIRSSFPRLCITYKQNGECNKVFCGYLHLCPDIILGKCTVRCKSWNNAHNWSTEHNKKVLYNFDLSFLEKDRATLITNLLFLKNEGLLANPDQRKSLLPFRESAIKQYADSSAVAKSTEKEKRPLILCQFYLNGNCNKNPCTRLHMCKEFLVNGNKCSIGHCKYGFSHDPLDENNAGVMRSHKMDHFPPSILFKKLRNSFPRMCKGYVTSGTCSSKGCNRIHICQHYLSNNCPHESCTRSHDFQDTHNLKVLSFFSLDIMNVKYVASNILYTKQQYPAGVLTNIDDSLGKSSVFDSDGIANIPSVEDVFLFVLRSSPSGSCSLLNGNLLHFFDGNKSSAEIWFKENNSIFRLSKRENNNVSVHVCLSHVEPCSFYWSKGCQDRHCQRFHICKTLLIGERECAMACQANHNFDSPREKNLIQVHNLGKLSNKELMIVLRYRYPHICINYLKQGCNLGESFCSHLHVCSEYMNGFCRKPEGVCKYKHKSALDSDQACRLMEDFNIKSSDFKYCVLQDGNICKEIIGSFEVVTIDDDIPVTLPRETTKKEPTEEDIFLFIMKSGGSCLLFDDKLLNFFNFDQTKAKEWFTSHNKTFRLFESENNNIIVCGCVDDVRPCRYYWMKGGGCRKNRCQMFHICRRFLSGINHSLISCKSNHDFENPREKNLIKEHNLKKLSDEEVITLLKNRYPFVCSDYLDQHCNLGENLCPHLHICEEYVADKCKKQEGVCKYKHQNALQGEQAHRLMKEFHLDEAEFKLCLMFPKRQEIVGSVSKKTADVEGKIYFSLFFFILL